MKIDHKVLLVNLIGIFLVEPDFPKGNDIRYLNVILAKKFSHFSKQFHRQ